MKKPVNPFPLLEYIGPEFFCDRDTELATLKSSVKNGRNVTLVSPRRMGKTLLVFHLFNFLENEGWKCIYVDVQDTANMQSLLNRLATSIVNSLKKKPGILKKVMDFVKSFRPVISTDAYTGEFTVEIKTTDAQHSKATLHELFAMLAQHDRVLIVLDEFQRITEYEEAEIEGWFRSQVQTLGKIRFVFTGSQQHILSDIFFNPKRPFYQSAQLLKLTAIPPDEYQKHIDKMFKMYARQISKDSTRYILEWALGHTYYVQNLLNRVFETGEVKIQLDTVKFVIDKVLLETQEYNRPLPRALTVRQWNLLKAVAKKEILQNPTSQNLLRDFNLGTGATVIKSIATLLDIELIYKDYIDDEEVFRMNDIYLMRLIQRKF